MPHSKKIWYAPYKFEAYGEEEIQAVVSCLRDGWLAPGPRTEEFEQKVAALFAKKHGMMVNSGSSANMTALASIGVGPGDEIITSALSFATVLAPVVQLGATPIFVDAEPRAYVTAASDVKPVLDKLTPKTKAIFLPNLVGAKPDWKKLKEGLKGTPYEKVYLIEDSCDTITHTPDSDIAITSFYASHVITAGGGGGMVMWNDEELKKKGLMYRDWGRIGNNCEDPSVRFEYKVDGIEYDFKFLYGVKGYNFKSTEMNAAFGLEQLKKLDRFFEIRRRNIQRYMERLKDVPFIELPVEREPYNWLAMPFASEHRGRLLRYLEENGVQTRVCFAGNITRHPAYREYFGEYPVADYCMKNGFLLGAHHGLSLEDIDYVCDLILNFKP
jgi:CDP-6-deoxy-D-xylo-4-hexulose-3-dehydrase